MKDVTWLYCKILGCRSQVWTYLDVRFKFCTTTVKFVEKERTKLPGTGNIQQGYIQGYS